MNGIQGSAWILLIFFKVSKRLGWKSYFLGLRSCVLYPRDQQMICIPVHCELIYNYTSLCLVRTQTHSNVSFSTSGSDLGVSFCGCSKFSALRTVSWPENGEAAVAVVTPSTSLIQASLVCKPVLISSSLLCIRHDPIVWISCMLHMW